MQKLIDACIKAGVILEVTYYPTEGISINVSAPEGKVFKGNYLSQRSEYTFPEDLAADINEFLEFLHKGISTGDALY